MKKLTLLALITALSVATVAEAKRGGFKMVKSKPSTTQQAKKPDADFNNTPNPQAMPNGAAATAQNGNRLGNFATGAAAGYLLSNVLSPTEAQAKEQTGGQAVSSAQDSAVQTFKQIDPTDPNMIERNANYARYCLAGTHYIVSGSKAMVLVDSQNQPQRCVITP